MQSAEVCGVTQESLFNFWTSNLQETVGSKRWSQIRESSGVYLASVLGRFSLRSMDSVEIVSPNYDPGMEEFRQFADLTQIAEMMMHQVTSARSPIWMESAGAHILLFAGFFYHHNKRQHSIPFFAKIGRECYLMAAVGKREKLLKLIARGFDEYLFYLARLYAHLAEKKYLLKVDADAADKMKQRLIIEP